LSDPRVKVSMNFIGAPALKTHEFIKFRQKTIIGGSLQITAPLGQYDPNLRVNLGTNRWSLKPELGVSRALGRWTLELYGSVWLFTANHRYLQTSTLRQAPIGAVQGHVAYSFRPRLWAALDAVYFGGGRTTVNGVKRNDLQSNARYGFTFSVPLAKQHSLKFLFSTGLVTRIGSDFNAVGVAYQFAWGGGR
jgi:Putative MetA-pathway of phenol degradation